MARSTLSYWAACLDTILPRRRPKYTRTFKCDCGWRYRWKAHELIEQHKRNQTVICLDCGDVYRTLGGTITAIIPNPLNRSLLSDKTFIVAADRNTLLARYNRAGDGYSDYNFSDAKRDVVKLSA